VNFKILLAPQIVELSSRPKQWQLSTAHIEIMHTWVGLHQRELKETISDGCGILGDERVA